MSEDRPLPAGRLHRPCDTGLLDFESSAELADLDQMLGQARAEEAIELGTELDLQGYNLFVLGTPGSGRHRFILTLLRARAAEREAASDWCYVNDFDEPRRPRAIELPAGRGRRFREDMERLIEEARSAIAAAFDSEDYQSRRHAIGEEAKREQQKALEEVQAHAEQLGIAVIETATGFNFAPLSKGKPMTPEVFRRLPKAEQERLQKDTEKVGAELHRMLRAIPRRVRKVRERIRGLDREVALFAVGDLVEELQEDYAGFPRVTAFLETVREDIVDHVELFTAPPSEQPPALQMLERTLDHEASIARRYAVNLLIDRGEGDGAPVVVEDHPTYPYLMGRVEHKAEMGALTTDFTLIRPGALHRANGGYLVLDAAKVLAQPFAWDALKRALRSRTIDIKSLTQAYGPVDTISLEPEPIPLRVKIVVIGDRLTFRLLDRFDPEFPELFKVTADFEDDMVRSDENTRQMARLIATIARSEGLSALDRHAVARIVEESSRQAGDARMLSTRVRRLADIVREAHYWSRRNGNELIGREEVERAIEGQERRMGRVHDRLLREILRGTLMIDTGGQTVGQVNGLAALQVGDHVFAHPARITARLSMGTGRVVDIEREVELGGPIHSKGVLILSNYLSSHYLTDRPLSLSASLVFEQSYGSVEGDSASAAELCALLSALAGAPIRQSLAITGSVNQHGGIQAIGAVNEKIEGFFDVCTGRGLDGSHGVVIPRANVEHLMLRRRVIDAVEAGTFRVYAAGHVDQCMEALTGLTAGARDAAGVFPPESINGRVAARLAELADRRRDYASHRGAERR